MITIDENSGFISSATFTWETNLKKNPNCRHFSEMESLCRFEFGTKNIWVWVIWNAYNWRSRISSTKFKMVNFQTQALWLSLELFLNVEQEHINFIPRSFHGFIFFFYLLNPVWIFWLFSELFKRKQNIIEK